MSHTDPPRVVAASPELAALIDLDAEPQTIASGFVFSEGPVWDPEGERLLFNDIPGDTRYEWSEADGLRVLARPSNKANGMAPAPGGGLFVCEHSTSSLVHVDDELRRTVVATNFEGAGLNSPNDVVVGADGSAYFSDPPFGRISPEFGLVRERELAFQGVFRLTPDGHTELLADDFEIPNGLCFSPDGRLLYVNDSERMHVRRFTVRPDGGVDGGEVLYTQEGVDEPGMPDGMKVDRLGNLWTTGPGGVWITTAEGELLGRLLVDEVVGNLAWGGPDLTSLFLCSSTTVQTIETKVAGHRPAVREDPSQ